MNRFRKIMVGSVAASLLAMPMPAMAATSGSGSGSSSGTSVTAPSPAVTIPAVPAMPPDMMPATPDIKISEETAVSLVRELFNLPDDAGDPRVQLQMDSHLPEPIWDLAWYGNPQANINRYYRASVSAVTGQVWNYSFSDNTPPSLGRVQTRESAQEAAEEWLFKLVPQYLDQLKLEDDPLNTGYS